MNPTELALLTAASRRPGRRLKRVSAVSDRHYTTLRSAASRLRQAGLLYPARPACVLATGRVVPEDFEVDPVCAALLDAGRARTLTGQPDVVADIATACGTTPYAVETAIKQLRTLRLLHPWDGLVLTAAGIAALAGAKDA